MAKNIGNCPGPKPGPMGAVSQHKASASGYELPSTPRRVSLNQKQSSTGKARSPGLTNRS